MINYSPRKLVEYGIYITILLMCITGLYWRFWYRPGVEPVMMIDPNGLAPKKQVVPSPLLDPAFTWSVVRVETTPPIVILKSDGDGKTIALKIGDQILGWKIKVIKSNMVILTGVNGDEHALFYSPERLKN